MALLITMINANGQVSLGSFTMFPDDKLINTGCYGFVFFRPLMGLFVVKN